MESRLQGQIIRWLKSKGAYVIKCGAGPGVPVGCPDILFLYEGAWGAIEVKASRTARYRPGQKMTLYKLNGWSPFVYTAHPENWPQIRAELVERFF